MSITKEQLDSFWQGKSNKERFAPEAKILRAERTMWFLQFGKTESDVFVDKFGEYIIAEVEQEPINNDEPRFVIEKMKLPESIQIKNIKL